MIGIGINENVYLKNAELDAKGTLDVSFEQKTDKEKLESPFEILTSDEHVEMGGNGISVRLFPPLPPKEGNDRTEAKNVELIGLDINKTRGILTHLLRGYLTSGQIKEAGGLNPFRGITITKENYNQLLQQKEVLESVHRNMATDFIALVKPFLNDPERLFRLLLVRQSKEKHFATFRGRFLEENPIWESMEIPKEASKVKFTDYENSMGLTHAIPYQKPASNNAGGGGNTGNSGGGGEAPLTAANVFG